MDGWSKTTGRPDASSNKNDETNIAILDIMGLIMRQ